MKQNTNQTIIKNQDLKFLSLNKEDSSLITYNNFKIKKYINQLFLIYGLLIHSYKLNYSNSEINILISYFITKKTIEYINNNNKKTLKLVLKKQNPPLGYKGKKKNFLIKKRIKILKKYKNFTNKKNKIKIKNNLNLFINNIIESLKLYTKNKILKIKINFQTLNKNFSLRLENKKSKHFRNIMIQLKKFNKMLFFNETLNILLICIRKTNSSKILSEYIALQFNLLKKHNYFLIFIKQSLKLMYDKSFSNILGCKISIKGRFNGAPRSKKKTIKIGLIKLQKINSIISYNKVTSFTKNGTFGIKVWIYEK